jgi:hypothetical protein
MQEARRNLLAGHMTMTNGKQDWAVSTFEFLDHEVMLYSTLWDSPPASNCRRKLCWRAVAVPARC